jgi:Cof subfamily protein (haloacid dehalogenase superfamily)
LIELVTIDLDGTLLNTKSQISDSNRNAINKCLAKGIKVVITTGKNIFYVSKIVKKLGLVDMQVVCNGAAIVNAKMEPQEVLKIPKEFFLEVVRLFREHDKGFVLHCLNGFIYYERDNIYFKYISGSGERLTKIDNIINEEIIGNALMFTYPGIIGSNFYDLLVDNLENKLRISRGGIFLSDIFNLGAGKTNAIKKILEIYNIDRRNVLAIGDGENDIGMIKFAGKGVAMGNSFETVKNSTDIVVSDNNNDGVAEAIFKYVLN